MPLNIDWQQILLHLLNFTVLLAILYFLLYKPVKKFMDKRSSYYKDMDDKAKSRLAEAESLRKDYQEKLDAVEQEIAAQKEKAHFETEQAVQEKLRGAEKEAAQMISQAQKSIEEERSSMLKKARAEITDMVAGAAEKLVGQATTSQAFDQFLEAAKRGGEDD